MMHLIEHIFLVRGKPQSIESRLSSNLLILYALLFFGSAFAQNTTTDLTVFSFNIRYNSDQDGINIWENRKAWLTQSIRFFEADLVGTQEVTYTQLQDMQQLLPNYKYVGIGRKGENQGEYSAIFYNKERIEVEAHDTFWLSETPDQIASKGWDAALPRIVTWALVKDKQTGNEFYLFNTHFDHRGKQARRESAVLLLQKIKVIAHDKPVIVTGDFNSSPKSKVVQILMDSDLKDPYLLLDEDHVYGPEYSANGWEVTGRGPENRIDYIFYQGALKPLSLQILDGQRGERFISDHFPIIGKFEWEASN